MEPYKGLEPLQKLLQEPAFTAEEAKKHGVSSALLAYYVKKGTLRRLGRGIYQSTSYQSPPACFRWDDLIEAIHAIPGGTICLISALAIYEMTDEIPRQHWIGVSHQTSIKRGNDIRIVRFRNMELGKTTIDLEGISVPIFDRERTIVDSFRLLSLETAIKALKMGLSHIDLNKLQDYAKKLRVNITPYLITATT